MTETLETFAKGIGYLTGWLIVILLAILSLHVLVLCPLYIVYCMTFQKYVPSFLEFLYLVSVIIFFFFLRSDFFSDFLTKM